VGVASSIVGVEERIVGGCRSVLANFVLHPYVVDQWMWRHDPIGGYSVRGTYKILTAQDVQDTAVTTNLI
jgi:hypothetical protein